MTPDRIAVLEHRIAELERKRRSTLTLSVLAVAFAAVVTHSVGIGAQGGSDLSTVRAPFRIVNPRGEEIFTVTQAGSETRLSIFDHGVASTVLAGGDGPSFLVLGGGSKGTARIGTDFEGLGTGPSILLKDSNGEVFRAGSKEVSIQAPLTVTPAKEPMLLVDNDNVRIFGTLAMRASKGSSASIGPSGLRILGADGAAVASLGVDDAGKGRLVVGLAGGARGVLGQPPSGGISFGLFDAPGAQYRIGMSATPGSSSFLRMFSGKRSVDLTVTPASSAVHVSNDAGFASASLTSTANGFGQLELGDAAGNTTVEAGTTDEGKGVVRVGPRMGGVVGFEGSMPWALLGKK